MAWIEHILGIGIPGAIEILILWIAFYYTIFFFRGTRSAQVLSGLVALVLLLALVTRFLHLDILNWILQRFSVYIAIALLIIFQPEIRRALAELGKQNKFGTSAPERETVDAIVEAATLLSSRKIGALIAVERKIGTRGIMETGKPIDARVTAELLSGLFFPRTPLHDGGVIIRNNRIAYAGCVFPLSHQSQLSRSVGTRHRAAVGITEESDALVVVVSEETGAISIAFNGRLTRGVDEDRLRRTLTGVLLRAQRSAPRRWARVRRWMNGSRGGSSISVSPAPPPPPISKDPPHAISL
ncbi:MAG: diadenylate cyclase CdaA [Kiritimatiellae bacterium]|nr:diadenylate cyclase CdaA [Kiritimatiellia bacterium]